VPLGVLAPSDPYIYSALTVVLGPNAAGHHIAAIGDLAGLRIGIESGTLADALLMTFDNGKLIDDITHLVPARDDLLGTLERGGLDATLLDLRRLDAYRATHPDTRLTPSGYFYPIGVNRGYVGLASNLALLAEINKALSALQADGTVARLAEAAGVSFLPPREPVILGDAMMRALHQN
jgi:ABC-type amino acid transport substrate-binding protein